MSCLQIQIEQVIPPLPLVTGVTDDLSVTAGIADGYHHSCFVGASVVPHDLAIQSSIRPLSFDLGAGVSSPQISVTVALVCRTRLSNEEYLLVLEGNVILLDGQFVKVIKA